MEKWNSLLGVGVDPRDMTLLQMSLRAAVIFFAALFLIQFAHKRFLAGKTAFDFLLIFILGSMLSRAINGTAPITGTIFVGFVVVLIHRGLDFLACEYKPIRSLLKGSSALLIHNGQLDRETMRKHHITEADIEEDMRLKTNARAFGEVAEARLERNGEISVIARS